MLVILTKTVESLAAMAKRSAQDTVRGHSFSSADLISSRTSKPRAESLLGFDLFSLAMVPLLSISNEASQPCNIYNLCQPHKAIVIHDRVLLMKFTSTGNNI